MKLVLGGLCLWASCKGAQPAALLRGLVIVPFAAWLSVFPLSKSRARRNGGRSYGRMIEERLIKDREEKDRLIGVLEHWLGTQAL